MRKIVNLILSLVLTVSTAVLISSCGESNAEATDEESAVRTNEQIVNVRVEKIQPRDFNEIIRITGSVASYADVMVPAEEGGRVVKWFVPKGAHVARNQILVQLDSLILKAAYEAAEANYMIAHTNYEKQKKVYEEQAISELQVKTFEYQRDAARAQSMLAKARFEKTKIRSPIAGVLNDRLVDAGEMIGPGAPIAHVVNTGRLKIEAGIPERYAGGIRSGDAVTFTVDALPGRTFKGKVAFVAAAVNKDNRSVPVEVLVTSGVGKLKPDMIATMHLSLSTRPNSIVIHEDFMQQVDKDVYVVYVVEDDIARKRTIDIGATGRGEIFVSGGLEAGDRLITLGYQNVADGQKVHIEQ